MSKKAQRMKYISARTFQGGIALVVLALAFHQCAQPSEGKQQQSSSAEAEAFSSWTTDYESARSFAMKTGKKTFLLFTGSDWCRPCINLEGEVFHSEEFKNLTKDLVLIKLDFPRRKPQDPELRKRNMQLMRKYRASGFPTVIILSPDGKELYRKVGYRKGEKENFLNEISKIIAS